MLVLAGVDSPAVMHLNRLLYSCLILRDDGLGFLRKQLSGLLGAGRMDEIEFVYVMQE